MILKRMQVGPIGTNCYLIGDEETKLGAIVDPGDEPDRILQGVRELGLTIQFVLLTHGHYDHTTGVRGVVEQLNVPVYIHKDEVAGGRSDAGGLQFGPIPQLQYYGEGDCLSLGGLTIEVMHTPGHSKGSVTLKVGDVLLTGDTLFRDSCGRTDLYGGNYQEILQSLKRLHDLPGDYQVYPGHEAPSTLSRERANNFYMREAVK
ncbi:MAG: MBL fold metallo-hydrolase [Oscillospiraceae bacterium]|jgi:hydroxyacylglutathione hydrolase